MDPITSNFLTSVAAGLTGKLLNAAGRRIANTFSGPMEKEALHLAVRDGIVALLLTIPTETEDERAHLDDIFQDIFQDEDTAKALVGILRGMPPDLEDLQDIFSDQGFVAEQIAGFDFREAMQAFTAAFLESAESAEVLQPLIKIGLLRKQAGLQEETLASMRELISFLRQAKEESISLRAGILHALEKKDAKPVEYRPQVRGIAAEGDWQSRYLRTVWGVCDRLELINFDESSCGTGDDDELKISQVFTTLNLANLEYAAGEDVGEVIRGNYNLRPWSVMGRVIERHPIKAVGAVASMDRLVILGRPGSGKSTLVNHLAGQLAQRRANMPERLTECGWSDEKRPLPVRIVLRKFAAWLPDEEQANAGLVGRYLEKMLSDMDYGEAYPYLKRVLWEEGGIIFFDGLDEVPAGTGREKRKRIIEAIRDFCAPLDKCKVVVTSREYAYTKEDSWRLPENEFPVVELAPFSEEQIGAFAQTWYGAVGRKKLWDRKKCDAEAESLFQAVRSQPHLKDMAGSPLLLTIMTQLHGRDGTLPRDRAELYKRAVRALLSLWENRIVRDAGGIKRMDPGLVMQLGVREEILQKVLERVAFLAHERQEGERETGEQEQPADILRADLRDELEKELKDLNKAQEVIDYIQLRSGLLIARDSRTYAFPHRTFQEYLTASYILGKGDCDRMLKERVKRAPDWWREVFLLAAGSARDNPRIISDLVDCLLPDGPKDEKISLDKHIHACLAATALAETGSAERVRRELAEDPEGGRFNRTHQTILQWLLAAMRFASGFDPRFRAEAGRMLGALGDPRPGVGLDSDGLPDMVWLDIDDGPFVMGDGDEEFECRLLTRPYQISKYPVTVAQFRAFMDDGGYGSEDFWTTSGWEWRQKEEVTGQRDIGGVFATANHPVVGVSWYEAMAFCTWLSHRTGWQVSMPTEAQWERAARGMDGREYPFGSTFKPDVHGNVLETGLQGTSAVGLFTEGDSECGASDMAGNVWEWCLTKWWDNYTDYETKADDNPEGNAKRMVRGGSWINNSDNARCADHDRGLPGLRYLKVGFRCVRTLNR
jgi:formylglycine-generating enzyme required for sulfatase activity/energy-coupling factor transporter ATP-binding protein EcfA2